MYGDGSYEPVSRKDARALLKKLKPMLDSRRLEEAEKPFLHAKYGDWNRSPDESVLRSMDKALTDRRVAYIEYYSPDLGSISSAI